MLLKLLAQGFCLSMTLAMSSQTGFAQSDEDLADANLAKFVARRTTVSELTHDAKQRSGAGRELQVIPFTAESGQTLARFLVQGGLHGNEGSTSTFVLWLASRYAQGASLLNQLGPHIGIDFLPYANPDGDQANTRANQHGVNLNRNFGVLWGVSRENPGISSFSEAETRAIRSLFAARNYTAAVDVHGYINWIVVPSAPEAIKALGYQPMPARIVAYHRWRTAFKQEMPVLPGYQLKTGAALGDGGAFEDWAFWSQGVFAHCLEMERSERFALSYRPDFNHFGDLALRALQAPKVDSFKRYEAFIYKMFVQALNIQKMTQEPATLAGK